MVGYANIPQNLRDYFKIKKIEKPAETDSIEYLKFDKSTHPSIYKYRDYITFIRATINFVFN